MSFSSSVTKFPPAPRRTRRGPRLPARTESSERRRADAVQPRLSRALPQRALTSAPRSPVSAPGFRGGSRAPAPTPPAPHQAGIIAGEGPYSEHRQATAAGPPFRGPGSCLAALTAWPSTLHFGDARANPPKDVSTTFRDARRIARERAVARALHPEIPCAVAAHGDAGKARSPPRSDTTRRWRAVQRLAVLRFGCALRR